MGGGQWVVACCRPAPAGARVALPHRPDRVIPPSVCRCRLLVIVTPRRQRSVLRCAAAPCSASPVCDAFGPSVHLVNCAALLACMQHTRLAPAPCSLDTQSSSSSDWDAVPRGVGWPRLARSGERAVLRHDCLGTRSATAARPTAPGSAGRPTVRCKLL